MTLGAAAARPPSLLKMVVDDDRGVLATGCPAVPLLGQDERGPQFSLSAAASTSMAQGGGWNWR